MLFLALIAFAAAMAGAIEWWGRTPWIAAPYIVGSVLCFVMYMMDKAAARAGRWRTSENLLLLAGLACGWPGAVLAQALLRHKSSKQSFRARLWVTIVLNAGLFIWLVSPWSPLRHLR
ncbi:DUF1294 domain-containing protein [Massilia sp. CF038]|uniref:DUF1294 domain-containing protein n=1 Tax=Massilia sp. CF038 TaxID=1881045 RepID=UPI0009188427|nr:DUF1294 domain-containing protein [Massilia sp. CF038]SHH17671.1 Uncharacterized membrane protein YsdA, DUF1294 family [Massilia sp. CF038]